jgi:hypothetical protein
MTKIEADTCDFCRKGRIDWRVEEMRFRQWSDKGYVRCRVALSMGTCDNCGAKTLEPESNEIFDAAFRREYDKLP